ncbi:MAG TPA: hypothetical protein VF678_05770, partial [bacterium]
MEAIADYEWCAERNGRMRRYYHGKLAALHAGDPAAAPHCEHDPHRWHHSAQDCTREERRLNKLRDGAVLELETLQQLRRQNLLNDAMAAAEGRPMRPVLPNLVAAPQLGPDAKTATSASSVRPHANFAERRKECVAPVPGIRPGKFPVWVNSGGYPVYPEELTQVGTMVG